MSSKPGASFSKIPGKVSNGKRPEAEVKRPEAEVKQA
jgi:hypothetical protein